MSSNDIVTSEVRFAFLNVFKPRKQQREKDDGSTETVEEYSVTALFPNREKLTGQALADYDACIAKLKAAAQAAAVEKWGDKLKEKNPDGSPKMLIRTPFRDQADKAEDYEGYEAGAIFINCKAQNPPGIVDELVQDIVDPRKLYSGCYGRLVVRAYAYKVKGNAGVSFGLQHIQKTRDGEPLGGSGDPSKHFQPVAGAVPAAGKPVTTDSLFG